MYLRNNDRESGVRNDCEYQFRYGPHTRAALRVKQFYQ